MPVPLGGVTLKLTCFTSSREPVPVLTVPVTSTAASTAAASMVPDGCVRQVISGAVPSTTKAPSYQSCSSPSVLPAASVARL